MKKVKVIKLTESDIERMVNRVIDETDNQVVTVNENDINMGSISKLDNIIKSIRLLKTDYENFANSVTGTGYSDEIDGITKKINDLEGKLLDVKSNSYKFMSEKNQKMKAEMEQSRKRSEMMNKEKARQNGSFYNY